jgi:hypothetical protein
MCRVDCVNARGVLNAGSIIIPIMTRWSRVPCTLVALVTAAAVAVQGAWALCGRRGPAQRTRLMIHGSPGLGAWAQACERAS